MKMVWNGRANYDEMFLTAYKKLNPVYCISSFIFGWGCLFITKSTENSQLSNVGCLVGKHLNYEYWWKMGPKEINVQHQELRLHERWINE